MTPDVVSAETGQRCGLRAYAAATWTPPFAAPLPSDAPAYAERVSVWKAARRRATRELHLALHGQRGLERTAIAPTDRRLLWIHQGTPQVGDSLMDLAARQLLAGRCDRLDLLTEPHLLPLYQADRVFTQVASDASELSGPYDLVLLHSASSRSVKDKLAFFRSLPFVHVQGCYTGPEFNRTLFGFYRLAQLLGMAVDADELAAQACPVMWASAADQAAIDALDLPAEPVAIALGGVRDWRTYTRWSEVLTQLQHRLDAAGAAMPPLLLIGADNGLALRDQLRTAHADLNIIDRVGQHSLPQVYALLQRCKLVLAADGGLLHVAQAARVPVVGLFAGVIDPSYRITAANPTWPMHAPERVDQIEPAAVAEQVAALL